jgi:hypothetical protein
MNIEQVKEYLAKIEYPKNFIPEFNESSFIKNYKLEHSII